MENGVHSVFCFMRPNDALLGQGSDESWLLLSSKVF